MILFDFLSFATEILICYREEAELPNNPKVLTLNIFWSQAIDGHWYAIFLTTEFRPVLKDCFQYMQDDNRNILHTGRLLGSIGNRYIPFFACIAFVLWIFTVCCNDSCARKILLLGSMMRQWPYSRCFLFLSGVLFCRHPHCNVY